MRKFYTLGLVACMALLGSNVSAQNSPLTWGVKAGVNLSNASISDDDDLDKKAKVGFQIGVTADYALTNNFYLQSGLSFTTKGAKIKFDSNILDSKFESTYNLMYLQVPVMAAYKLDVAPGTKIVFNAGPYLAYGIGGKTKYKGTTINNIRIEEKYNSFGDDGLKRFDFGLGAGVGVEYGQITVGLNYEHGLTNIARDNDNFKNRNASLTVGYKF